MAKKEKFAKNKNGKVPFAVLRKGALCALIGTTVLAGGALAGCDEGAFSGPAGAKFYYGAEAPDATKNPGKNGDFYIETADGDVWQYQGNEGWIYLTSIKGPQGDTPEITISENGYWVIDGFETDVNAKAADGKSAFDLAVEHEDFEGTVAEWLASLKGAQGERGYYVTSIREVKDDNWNISSHFEFTLNDEGETVVSTESVSRLMPNYYYGATTGAEVLELIELGAENIQLENDIEVTDAIVIEHDLSIDLNTHKLTYSNETQIIIDNGIIVEFKDGEMDFAAKTGATASLRVEGGASLILDRVDYVSSGTNVMVIENATSVKILDSRLTGAVYCVGTNASVEENFGVEIEIDDCELTTTSYEWSGEEWYDTTPILINIPCTATIKDSKITGNRQAVVVRGGDVVIEDCTLISTGKDVSLNGLGLTYNTEDAVWGSGNAVPLATLVAGNDGRSTYAKYPTNLDLIDVEIISQKASLGIPMVWIGGGNKGENGLTVNYSAKQLDESFMTGMMGNGENFTIYIDVNDYDSLRGIMMIAIESQGKIIPRLTQDILAYDYDITVGEYVEAMMLRDYAEQNGVLTEFDIWTMFGMAGEYYVEEYEEFMYAIQPIDEGGLGLDISKIVLLNNICVDDYCAQGELSIEDVEVLNSQISPNGYRFVLNVGNLPNATVSTAEGLQSVISIYGSRQITLADDIVVQDESEQAKIIITHDTIINFEDSTLNLDIPGATGETANWNGINVNGGNVVFEGNEGGITTAANEELYAVTVRNGANLTINGGIYIGGTTAINVVQGTVTINGGFFANRIDGEDESNGLWTINCIDDNYKNGTAVVIITGGTFVNFNPADNLCEGEGTSYVAEGYTVVEEKQDNGDMWYTVVPKTV